MDRSGTIVLVVDDEPAVRAVIFLHLKKAGYTVLEAASGEQALAILAVQPNVSLALIDCDMPKLSGPELDKLILAKWPGIKILAMSGRPRSDELPDAVEFINKPFRGTDLITKIEGILRH